MGGTGGGPWIGSDQQTATSKQPVRRALLMRPKGPVASRPVRVRTGGGVRPGPAPTIEPTLREAEIDNEKELERPLSCCRIITVVVIVLVVVITLVVVVVVVVVVVERVGPVVSGGFAWSVAASPGQPRVR